MTGMISLACVSTLVCLGITKLVALTKIACSYILVEFIYFWLCIPVHGFAADLRLCS